MKRYTCCVVTCTVCYYAGQSCVNVLQSLQKGDVKLGFRLILARYEPEYVHGYPRSSDRESWLCHSIQTRVDFVLAWVSDSSARGT